MISRGHGLGHAQRDAEIARMLLQEVPGADIRFASYGEALLPLRRSGFPVLPLEVPFSGANGERLIAIHRLIREIAPDLVVSDEEVLAPPVARALGVPSVYLTNWLLHEEGVADCSFLTAADAILYLDFEEHVPSPDWLPVPTFFVGPILPSEPLSVQRCAAVRRWLQLEPDAHLLVGACGGGAAIDLRFFRTLIEASARLAEKPHLLLLAGSLAGSVRDEACRAEVPVTVLTTVDDPLEYFGAADLVVTRAGHSTLWELAWLAIPSVSVPRPPSFNRMNEAYARAMDARGTTRYLEERAASAERLASECALLLSGPPRRAMVEACRTLSFGAGAADAAALIASHLPATLRAGTKVPPYDSEALVEQAPVSDREEVRP